MKPLPKNNRMKAGYIVIIVTFILTILAMIGIALASLIGSGSGSRSQEASYARARYEATAGIEWARKQIDSGQSPNTTGKSFAGGTFDTSLNDTTFDLTSIGHYGSALVAFVVPGLKVGATCVTIDVSSVSTGGANLNGIKFKLPNGCLSVVTIDKMLLTWSPVGAMQLTQAKLPSATVYDSPPSPQVDSGVLFDVTDYLLTQGNTPACNYKFSRAIPGSTTFTVTLYFKDGTKVTSGPFTP